jgi:hypothetical protein
MDMMDNVNFSMRDDVLKFAASGTDRDWKMRQELRSGRYTTRWEELFEVSEFLQREGRVKEIFNIQHSIFNSQIRTLS